MMQDCNYFDHLLTRLCDCIVCSPGCGDARYRTLAERYANLSRDFENLKCQYRDILLIHEDVCAESKLLKKGLLALQSSVSILYICFLYFLFIHYFLDQELIPYCYSSWCSCCWGDQ